MVCSVWLTSNQLQFPGIDRPTMSNTRHRMSVQYLAVIPLEVHEKEKKETEGNRWEEEEAKEVVRQLVRPTNR